MVRVWKRLPNGHVLDALADEIYLLVKAWLVALGSYVAERIGAGVQETKMEVPSVASVFDTRVDTVERAGMGSVSE